ncbi:glutamine synthetase family protein [Candidatus Viridilinea mediisalina]|uniref:Glutamine synthetase n=1 Tax=Candidatus Viridilinea mediisalina TaxID=2024553 RepID=A0A2A6RGL8_9CHLR|nr:glutamine synthetase family protein [Candidatus Viridilinea mediisalina]PDW02083.1 glutamine synthetase [Candidatus Viridilinea mediisalina]
MSASLRDFLEITYDELEELNLAVKQQRSDRVPLEQLREERTRYLTDERRIKAVSVCFADLEGRLHMLDYDKKFLLSSDTNLTFDGSSIRGFSRQTESDLRLAVDWSAFYWLPSDVFGPGKVLVFGDVLERDGTPYGADMRARLKALTQQLYERDGLVCNAANEIEGFLFKGRSAEQRFRETDRFELVSTGGYYHTLPNDPLRMFIDSAAEVQRAMAFNNEKDHPEVAPSQFEMNYSYAEATIAADQVLLYKLICRQLAHRLDMTASFLPKPVTGVNGSGMHTNLSVMRDGTNLFYDATCKDELSAFGWQFVNNILEVGQDLCLILNPSVNAYRRLDPNYEAPNQIKSSASDRSSMIRIPIFNAKSARIEVRSIAPDANPYMAIYALLHSGLQGSGRNRTPSGLEILPDNIFDAIEHFRSSAYTTTLFGAAVKQRFIETKLASAERCPRRLGTVIKRAEVQFHHEVTNQQLWSLF